MKISEFIKIKRNLIIVAN